MQAAFPLSGVLHETPPPTRGCEALSRSGSGGRRRPSPPPAALPTRVPSATPGCAASAWASPGGLRLHLAGALTDDAEDAVSRLLDRQLGDVDHGAAEAP